MSEQEFDLYLKLLAKCLRLTSGQREQIADELRDHLEERLEELARAGVPRDKAVVQALDEFGDAAVLAAHFTTIARLKRRRFLMRLSLGSVGALTAALLITFAFWPDNRAVRGPEQIVAQDKPKAERPKGETSPSRGPTGSTSRHRGNTHPRSHQPPIVVEPAAVEHPLSSDVIERSKPETRIAAALTMPIDFNIEPQSLKDALDFIATHYQIPILIDQRALDDANVDATTEVKLNVPGIALSDAFQLIFDQISSPLGCDIRNGVLMISTIDKIDDHLEVVVYDCRDLIQVATLESPVAADPRQADAGGQGVSQSSVGGGRSPAARKRGGSEKASDHAVDRRLPLIQTIISATGPGSWDETASISEIGGLLIVRQNPRVHERIKRLLDSIRLMRKDGAFATLTDQYDAEAKKRAADQNATATRLGQLEHELEQLRKEQAVGVKGGQPTK